MRELLFKKHWWQGEKITNEELKFKLQNFHKDFLKGLSSSDFSILDFYRQCDEFSKKLKTDSSLIDSLLKKFMLSEDDINFLSDFLSEEKLKIKMKSDVGTMNPFESHRVDSYENFSTFEAFKPLGVLVQVLPGNDLLLPFLSLIEGLMTGNLNVFKLSSGSSELTIYLVEKLIFINNANKNNANKNDPTDDLKKRIVLLQLSSHDSDEKEMLHQVFNLADGVVAWGGEEALKEIKKMVPSHARFIDWGHRISFAYITRTQIVDKKILKSSLKKLVKDLFIYNQQACSSPQSVYIENATFEELREFSIQLKKQIEEDIHLYSLLEPSFDEWAEINKVTLIHRTEKSLKKNFAEVIQDNDERWRLLIDSRSTVRASPLYRTLWVKTVRSENLWDVFRPFSAYLQTVGLSCQDQELSRLSQEFFRIGVTRIRPLGEMQESYIGEPHDGHPTLVRYLKKVSLKTDQVAFKNISYIEDIKKSSLNLINSATPVMTKTDFQNSKPTAAAVTELYFKSGGSSGEPKISCFTYDDYHEQMKYAAYGLIAAGLEPSMDRCMNLFFGGGLYGGFISFFSILEHLRAIQFPMSANMDFNFVGKIILQYQVNVLLGMPSYLMQLFEANQKLFKENKVIKKIFFGGEHFSLLQRKKLIEEFGVEQIISASYGSVDMGPLGYQCVRCPPGVHHLHHYLHQLEILSLNSDQPVKDEEVGRLVFSTKSRTGQNLLRYDIGDIGRWVPESCACLSASPRFELMGRHGDIFRVAGTFYNYNRFIKILSDYLNYDGEIQIVIESHSLHEQINLFMEWVKYPTTEVLMTEENVREILLTHYKDLSETVFEEKVVQLKIHFVKTTELKRSVASGKLLHIIDKRDSVSKESSNENTLSV